MRASSIGIALFSAAIMAEAVQVQVDACPCKDHWSNMCTIVSVPIMVTTLFLLQIPLWQSIVVSSLTLPHIIKLYQVDCQTCDTRAKAIRSIVYIVSILVIALVYSLLGCDT